MFCVCRSQFDLFEAMPGGLAGVRAVVHELHAKGIKVLIPYNPWDAFSWDDRVPF